MKRTGIKRSLTPLRRSTPLRAEGRRARRHDDEWQTNRAKRLEFAKGRCEYVADLDGRCTAPAVHVHHRLPTERGGGHELSNLLALCARCHLERVHGNPERSYRLGYLIRGGTNQ